MGSRLDNRKLKAIIGSLEREAGQIVRKTAFQVLAEAKVMAPVDTGALQNSLNAVERNPLSYRVQDGVEYGIYQELGTSRMAAQPFLVPAIESARRVWDREWKKLIT